MFISWISLFTPTDRPMVGYRCVIEVVGDIYVLSLDYFSICDGILTLRVIGLTQISPSFQVNVFAS